MGSQGVKPFDYLMNRKYGITLIELIVVLSISAMMAFAALAIFKNFRETTSVKVAARDVVNVMRLARQKAITERQNYYALYDTVNNKVWIQPASSYPPKNPDAGTEQSLPHRVKIDDVTSGGTDTHEHHTFTPKSTSTSGGVYLEDEKEKLKYSVRLESATARARIYSYW